MSVFQTISALIVNASITMVWSARPPCSLVFIIVLSAGCPVCRLTTDVHFSTYVCLLLRHGTQFSSRFYGPFPIDACRMS